VPKRNARLILDLTPLPMTQIIYSE
jgi:hypothetical protein